MVMIVVISGTWVDFGPTVFAKAYNSTLGCTEWMLMTFG